MFGKIEVEVLDEITIGKRGTKLRLVQTEKGKKRIENYSFIDKSWSVMYRYNVEEAWASWKNIEKTKKNRKKK